ncbi:MAG: hypothetical protein NTV57_03140 [Cyanobacteria bacterium]|nr:hypothetical protein [Cyanobacteriota bacterium]
MKSNGIFKALPVLDNRESWLLGRPRNLWLAIIALMAFLAMAWLAYQSFRYFADPGVIANRHISPGAIDLHNRFRETRAWFLGRRVYGNLFPDAVYPPASYALFKIAFSSIRWRVVKIAWYILSLISVSVFSWQLVRHSLAQARHERIFIGLMPFAFYATGAALGNGQLVLFVLPLLLSSLLLLAQPLLSKRHLWIGSGLMVVALIQPTIAAPFFWLLLLRPPRFRPGAYVVSAYLALSAFAISFQLHAFQRTGHSVQPVRFVSQWARKAHGGTVAGSVLGGYGTVHNLLAYFHLSRLNMPVSVGILLALGAWIFRNRRADLWLLLGVTSIVARVWAYHRWYDDLLLLLPLIGLFRLTRLPQYGQLLKSLAALLFVWIWMFLLAPGVLYLLPSPQILIAIQVLGWLSALVFLVIVVERESVFSVPPLASSPHSVTTSAPD